MKCMYCLMYQSTLILTNAGIHYSIEQVQMLKTYSRGVRVTMILIWQCLVQVRKSSID